MTDILKPGKFICPPNFQPIEGRSTIYLEDLEDDDTELWIIQAPVGVDVSKLNGQSIDLDSLSCVNSTDDKSSLQCIPTQYGENYESDFHLVVPKKSDKTLTCVSKSFRGHLLITEYISTSNLTSINANLVSNKNLDSENETQQTINAEPARKKKKEKHKNKNTSEHFVNNSPTISPVFTDVKENEKNINHNLENDELNVKKKHKKKKSKEQDTSSISYLEHDNLKEKKKSNKFSKKIINNQENAPEPMECDDTQNSEIKEEEKTPKKKKKNKYSDTNVTELNDTEMSINDNEVSASSERHLKKKSHKSSKKRMENQENAPEPQEYDNVQDIKKEKVSPKKKRNKHNDTAVAELNSAEISAKDEGMASPAENSNTNTKVKKKKKKKHDDSVENMQY